MDFVFYAVVADKKYELFLRKLFFLSFYLNALMFCEMELQTVVTPVGC